MARGWWTGIWQTRRVIRAVEGLQRDVQRLAAAVERAYPPVPTDPTPDEIGQIDTFAPSLAGRIDRIEAQFTRQVGRPPTEDELIQRLADEGITV